MPVRIASGSELKRVREFINPDGTLTTREQRFSKNQGVEEEAGDNQETRETEDGKTEETQVE